MFDEKLGEVLCETAEQMFFQEFQDHTADGLPDKVFWATISVRSPKEFEVIVAAEEQTMRQAIEMVFMDDTLSDERVGDVVAELANTIAGSLSRHISESSAVDLSPPNKGLGDAPEANKYHAFAGDDLTLFVAVRELKDVA